MPSPLTIASQKRVAVIGCNSETSLQGWLMSAYHHSNGSKLGSSHYLRLFVCTWSAVCSCSSNVSLPSRTGTIQHILIHGNVAAGRGLELGHAGSKSKEQLFCFAVLIPLFLHRRNGSSQGAKRIPHASDLFPLIIIRLQSNSNFWNKKPAGFFIGTIKPSIFII